MTPNDVTSYDVTPEVVLPLTTAMAFTVHAASTTKAPVYCVLDVVGVEPAADLEGRRRAADDERGQPGRRTGAQEDAGVVVRVEGLPDRGVVQDQLRVLAGQAQVSARRHIRTQKPFLSSR